MRNNNQRGFSLIEILMVLVLIAVLAAIAINAFINFRQEAQDANVAANLKVLRNAVSVQYAQMQLRCGTAAGVYPPAANVDSNDITAPASACDPLTEVTIESERKFVQGDIPIPPTGTSNTVIDCTAGAGDCTRGDAVTCDGGAAFDEQWCYNPGTGEIWLDSDDTDANGTIYEAY